MSGDLVSDLVAAWASWVPSTASRALVLAAIAWVIDRALRRRGWAGLRTAVWYLVLVRLVVPGDWLSFSMPGEGGAGIDSRVAGLADASSGESLAPLALGVWLLGVLVLETGTTWRRRRGWQALLAASDEPPAAILALGEGVARSLGLRRPPRLRIGIAGRAAFVTGWRSPVVVLPRDALSDPPARIELLLRHELMHVRRRDLLAAFVCDRIRNLFWFHPAAWIATRRLGHLREIGCDLDVAKRFEDDVAEYRRALAAYALRWTPHRASSPAFLRSRPRIMERLEHLATGSAAPGPLRALVSAAIVGALAVWSVAKPPVLAEAAGVPIAVIAPTEAATETRGCLELRYKVMGLLAAEEAGAPK